VGPQRVGKSTLLNAITGDESIKVEATLSAMIRKISSHESDIFIFWDTPGIEDWTETQAEATWNELFVETCGGMFAFRPVRFSISPPKVSPRSMTFVTSTKFQCSLFALTHYVWLKIRTWCHYGFQKVLQFEEFR